jgi:hypothetical protein
MGPLQKKVLMVLQAATRLENRPGLTYGEIARVISEVWGERVSWGSVCAAVSGMGNCRDRHWIMSDQPWGENPMIRRHWITKKGGDALRANTKRVPRAARPWWISLGRERSRPY